MCGICGFTGEKDRRLLEAMNKSLSHRGPDDAGFYEDEMMSLAHRRLSIIDLSPGARQPMRNEDSTLWMVVNGEIYNFKALREELESRGHAFNSQSDSEVIIHAYEEYGESFVNNLEGMFALAIWDSRKKKLILARDRIGIKPLYYAHHGLRLLFASEIKALLEYKSLKREINEDGFFQYLAFQCILTPETMFKGVYKLEPGSMLVFENNALIQKKYWFLDQSEIKECTEDEVAFELVDAVKSHLVADVPVGVLLSGGLDSSSIVAIMHEQGVKDIETFSVGFGQPDDELKFAGEVCAKFRTRHHELIIKPQDLKGLLKEIVWHMDEPLADGGAIATYLAAQKVREFVKVVLVGEGGDEALGGYNWYKLASLPLPQVLKKRLYFYFTTFYNGDSRKPFDTFSSLFEPRKNFLDSMAAFEIKNILPNSLLMKVDKMTMAHGLEARVPFLDHKFLLAALGLRSSKKVSLFSTKIFLRRYMRGRLPESILKRRKHGFILPIGKWLQNELRDFAQDILFSKDAYFRGILPAKDIENLFSKQKGLKSIENSSLLWKLLIFETWHKINFRGNN
ncbi:MAG: asparagine synthase (glutamine-hydrolyzing) [bacterium]